MEQVIEIETELGTAEAIKDKPGDPWVIGYPWASDRFYGSKTECRKRMQKRIKKEEE